MQQTQKVGCLNRHASHARMNLCFIIEMKDHFNNEAIQRMNLSLMADQSGDLR